MLSWFVSAEQINYLPKLKAEANNWSVITKFNNCFIMRSPSLFSNEYPREVKPSAIFHARAMTERRKTVLFMHATKHSWMTLCISRPLFVGSYLQVTWWALGQWKSRTICMEVIFFLFFLGYPIRHCYHRWSIWKTEELPLWSCCSS